MRSVAPVAVAVAVTEPGNLAPQAAILGGVAAAAVAQEDVVAMAAHPVQGAAQASRL